MFNWKCFNKSVSANFNQKRGEKRDNALAGYYLYYTIFRIIIFLFPFYAYPTLFHDSVNVPPCSISPGRRRRHISSVGQKRPTSTPESPHRVGLK